MPPTRPTGHPFATRSEVIARHGMAATSQPLATQVALDLLKAGGSAVDAAIGANALLGLVEPTGCGLGGDLFAIVWDPEQREPVGLNASGRSPRALTLEELTGRGLRSIPPHGPLPVSVPGCVDGWTMLHGRFGRLSLREVLAPAIGYAREGAPISEVIAHHWARDVRALGDQAGFLEVFAPGGRAPEKGELFANPRLAATLEAIAEGGREAFYAGERARAMADHVRAQGGFLAYEDLAEHRGEWVAPLSVDYRGHTVWELPPNGQGLAALEMLRLLEGFDLAGMGFGSADYAHLLVETKKLAFEDRARYYADPTFAEVPVEELLSKQYADSRRDLIDLRRALSHAPAGDPLRIPRAVDEGDTVYLTVADGEGSLVSLIQSNFRGMGSGVTPADLGFVLQDRGQLFALEPGHPNVYAPGKRPFHTIMPGFVSVGDAPLLSFGVMGGALQPPGQVQILVNTIDFGMNVQEAGDAPRIVHVGSSQPTGERMTDGGGVFVEPGYGPRPVLQELRSRGHRLLARTGELGGYQGIRWDPEHGVFLGASESRKDGQAAGY